MAEAALPLTGFTTIESYKLIQILSSRFPLQPYRSETQRILLCPYQIMKYGTFRYDAIEVENSLKAFNNMVGVKVISWNIDCEICGHQKIVLMITRLAHDFGTNINTVR